VLRACVLANENKKKRLKLKTKNGIKLILIE